MENKIMSRLAYNDGLNFDIYIMDLCEMVKPKRAEDLEELSEELHQRIEMAIDDFIADTNLQGEYINQY